MADVNTNGIDFSDIAGVVGSLAGTINIPPSKNPNAITTGNVLTAVLKNPALLSLVLGLLSHVGDLFKKKPPVIAVTPVPPVPVVIPTLPPPVNPLPAGQRKVASLRTKWYFFERTENGSKVLDKATYDDIIAGNQFLTRGDRLHVDITPVDQNGIAFGPGDAENNALLLKDPSLGDVEGNHRFDHVVSVNGQEYHSGDTVPGLSWDGQDVVFLTSEYDDLACTPVLTVSRDLALNNSWNVSYHTIYTAPDGSKIVGPKTPAVIVKPWAKA